MTKIKIRSLGPFKGARGRAIFWFLTFKNDKLLTGEMSVLKLGTVTLDGLAQKSVQAYFLIKGQGHEILPRLQGEL